MKTCTWTETDEFNETDWNTECEQFCDHLSGTPIAYGYEFCPYCGKPLIMVELDQSATN